MNNALDKIQLVTSKLWCDQVEECSEEGEFGFKSDEEGPLQDQEQQAEEQSVNGVQVQQQSKLGKVGNDHENVEDTVGVELPKLVNGIDQNNLVGKPAIQESATGTIKKFTAFGCTKKPDDIQKEKDFITHKKGS